MFGRKTIEILSQEKKELQSQFTNLQKKMLEQERFIEEIQDAVSNRTLKIVPPWKQFCKFLLSEEELSESDQFQVNVKEDKNFYSISFILRNSRLNSYSKGRGFSGLKSRWYSFSGRLENEIEFPQESTIDSTESPEEEETDSNEPTPLLEG